MIKADAKLKKLLKGCRSTPCPQKVIPEGENHIDCDYFHWTCSGCGRHVGLFAEPFDGRVPEMHCPVCMDVKKLVKGARITKQGSEVG